MSQERIQKILAQAGIASRRKAEDLIRVGEVTVNGKVARLGEKADSLKDAIKVSGKLLHSKEPPVYVAFHKPKGVISMFSDPHGRPTLADFLDKVRTRLFPIGRLDFNSEGLILLTNDGSFAHTLQSQKNLPRTYEVKVKGHLSPESLKKIQKAGETQILEQLTSKTKLKITITEPGAFDLKDFLQIRGFLVEKIVRTSIGHLTLKHLPSGQFRHLKKSQVQALLKN